VGNAQAVIDGILSAARAGGYEHATFWKLCCHARNTRRIAEMAQAACAAVATS